MTPAQYRMARAALGWTVRQVAISVGLPTGTSKALRGGDGFSATAITRLRAAFEAQGIVFVEDSGSGPGVCFNDREKPGLAGEDLKATDPESGVDRGVGGSDNVPASLPGNHPRPSGPATGAIERMDAEIAADQGKLKRT